MPRERDYAYEALAEVTNTDMDVGRGELNAALRDIRSQEPEMATTDMSYELADLIHLRAKQYRLAMPEVMLTPTALAKHWARVEAEVPRETYTPPTPVEDRCATCHGHHFVFVGTRPGGFEEMGICPACSSADGSFWRFDGTKFEPLDPGRVRERMQITPPSSSSSGEIPSWVYVWNWARSRGAKRPFPQQAGETLDGDPLTEAEYETLLALWEQAGSPKWQQPLPTAPGSLYF